MRKRKGYPDLDLLDEASERILFRSGYEKAFAHIVQRARVILEALAQFLEHQEARIVKRNVQRGDGLVRTRAFLEVIVEITAALAEAAEQTRHEKRVVTDGFAHCCVS